MINQWILVNNWYSAAGSQTVLYCRNHLFLCLRSVKLMRDINEMDLTWSMSQFQSRDSFKLKGCSISEALRTIRSSSDQSRYQLVWSLRAENTQNKPKHHNNTTTPTQAWQTRRHDGLKHLLEASSWPLSPPTLTLIPANYSADFSGNTKEEEEEEERRSSHQSNQRRVRVFSQGRCQVRGALYGEEEKHELQPDKTTQTEPIRAELYWRH